MIFDSHFHIIDPAFPLIPNHGFLPETFSAEHYLKRTKDLNVLGGAIVSGSFQAFDQGYLLAALNKLGPNFVGVTQLPANTTDEEILQLHQAGVRAIRFNLKRGGSEGIEHLKTMAKRVFELAKWHCEFYVDAKDLTELNPLILSLPKASIDHLGLSKAGFSNILALAEKNIRIKASGFGRVDFDVLEALKNIYNVNPDALMFGTDLPSTRAPRAFENSDIDLLTKNFDKNACHKILYQNAASFYGLL